MTGTAASALLLAVALAAFVHFVRGGEVGFPPPHWPAGRARYFTRAASRTSVLFGVTSLLLLAAAGRLSGLVSLPREFAPLRAVTETIVLTGASGPMLAGGVVAGALIGAGGARLTRRRLQVGRIGALMPRARTELGWGMLLSLVAGVCEEWFFRLLLPLLLTTIIGIPAIGFLIATITFGVAHRYQGWSGMVATTLVGALLAWLYLATASLAVAIALHAFIDVNALVLRPLLTGRISLRERAENVA